MPKLKGNECVISYAPACVEAVGRESSGLQDEIKTNKAVIAAQYEKVKVAEVNLTRRQVYGQEARAIEEGRKSRAKSQEEIKRLTAENTKKEKKAKALKQYLDDAQAFLKQTPDTVFKTLNSDVKKFFERCDQNFPVQPMHLRFCLDALHKSMESINANQSLTVSQKMAKVIPLLWQGVNDLRKHLNEKKHLTHDEKVAITVSINDLLSCLEKVHLGEHDRALPWNQDIKIEHTVRLFHAQEEAEVKFTQEERQKYAEALEWYHRSDLPPTTITDSARAVVSSIEADVKKSWSPDYRFYANVLNLQRSLLDATYSLTQSGYVTRRLLTFQEKVSEYMRFANGAKGHPSMRKTAAVMGMFALTSLVIAIAAGATAGSLGTVPLALLAFSALSTVTSSATFFAGKRSGMSKLMHDEVQHEKAKRPNQ